MRFQIHMISFFLIGIVQLNVTRAQEDSLSANLTGETVGKDQFNAGMTNEPLELIRGRIAGLSISKRGSDPNEFLLARIRSGVPALADNKLLFVIDGIWDASPDMLSPDEIESIEVLKNISDLAGYGSQGGGGVIVINTRKAKTVKPISVDFNTQFSLNNPSKYLDLLSASQLRNQQFNDNYIDPIDGGADTDWQDEITRQTITQSYQLAVSGGLKQTSYRLSVNNKNIPGIVLGSDRKQSGVSLNLQQTALRNKLLINLNASYAIRNSNFITYQEPRGQDNVFFHTFRYNPTDSPYLEDGKTYNNIKRDFRYNNPLAIINLNENTGKTSLSMVMVSPSYKINNHWIIEGMAGHSFLAQDQSFRSDAEAVSPISSQTQNSHDKERFNFGTAVRYQQTYNQHHTLEGKLSYHYNLYVDDYSHSFEYFPDNQGNIQSSATIYQREFSLVTGLVQYSYKQLLYARIMASVERFKPMTTYQDSLLAEWPVRNATYPSISAGFNLHRLPFLQSVRSLDRLILKAGYGTGGVNWPKHIVGMGANEDGELKDMAKLREINLGINASGFDNALSFSATYYHRMSQDVLMMKLVPSPPNPSPVILSNIGSITNHGIELSLSAIPVQNKSLRWETLITLWRNNQRFESNAEFAERRGYLDGLSNEEYYYTQIIQEGSPLLVFSLPVYKGTGPDGMPILESTDGTHTNYLSNAKRVDAGNPDPGIELGWFNRLVIGNNWDVVIDSRYVGGNMLYNATRMELSDPKYLPTLNGTMEALNNYNEGIKANIISNKYLESAAYFRIDNLGVGYTFGSLNRPWAEKLRVYGGVHNLLTITNYSGLDPAMNYQSANYGIDYFNVYPLARSYYLGVSFHF